MHTRKLDKTEEMEIRLWHRKTNNKVRLSNEKYLLKKLMQDVDNLEKSHSNRVQKQNLVKVPLFRILSIQNTYEQGKKVKER